MNKKPLALFLILCCLLNSACAKSEAVSAEMENQMVFDTEAEILAAETSQTETEEIIEEDSHFRDVVDGKIRSWFTGEWIDEELAVKRPLAIMLNNTSAALPMSGVTNASVIYECPVEKRITRWMGIFEDWEDLTRIGSVRSCRLYYLQLAQEFDSVYAHFGQAVYAKDALNSGKYDVLSGATKGIERPATAMYDRISRPGKATEHTLYAFPEGILKDIEKKGYDMTMPTDYEGKFKFADVGETLTYDSYPDATFLQPGGTSGSSGFGQVKATFEYNSSDHLYYRSTYGNPHMDELSGEQVAVTNVIFQYCEGTVLDSKDYLHFATQTEKGKCSIFTNGKQIDGYWSNPGELGTPARYYTQSGEEIALNTGKTFICIVWNDYAEDVVIK